MSEQKQFDFPRAAKLQQLERAAMTGNVKSLLKALDGFARDKTECIATLHSIGVSMGVSASTARRAVRDAQGLGVLEVFGCPEDGRSNLYRIVWTVVFSLPDGMTKKSRSKPLPTPTNLEGDPYQSDRGPLPTWEGTPTNLGGVSATDTNDKETATIRQPERGDGGGGGISKLTTDNRQPTTTRPSGFWAWSVTRTDLGQQGTVLRLFAAATEAGLLSGLQLDQIRFLALVHRIRSDESIRNVTGYLVKLVETGQWNYLPADSIRKAWSQVRPGQPPPTPEQIAKVRSNLTSLRMTTNNFEERKHHEHIQ